MKKTLILTATAVLMGTTAMADTTRSEGGAFQVANLFERWERSDVWSSLTGRDRGDDYERYERYADRDDDWGDDDDDDDYDDRDDDYDDRDDDRDDDGYDGGDDDGYDD